LGFALKKKKNHQMGNAVYAWRNMEKCSERDAAEYVVKAFAYVLGHNPHGEPASVIEYVSELEPLLHLKGIKRFRNGDDTVEQAVRFPKHNTCRLWMEKELGESLEFMEQ